MPCTFSHPLAVVPLSRLCPARLNLASLAIRVFLFRSAVYSAAAFVPLLIISALALHWRLQARQGTTR